jgi:succinate dehydrogenase / fumarate reductase membrane anchor subunit
MVVVVVGGMKDCRSPLAKVKGLGRSPDASQHFWWQRLTALALVPLMLWFCFSVALLPDISYNVLLAWLHLPLNTVLLLLMIIVGLYHGQMGIQVIIEDYIANYTWRISAIIMLKGLTYFMMVFGVYSVLHIALGEA